MKKNYFKKLSFVMALAMIVTALAPAAGVFAAAAPKLNAKSVTIHVAEKTTDFDFNVANKKAGWKYTWKSSNEDVAEVASNGLVTAVGKGTATVSVLIKDKKGEKIDTLKASVVVRDNIKKLTIKNPITGDKLAVGAKYDFNRNFVTASGSTTKTSGVTKWSVDKTGATIVANSGAFVANEAGTYTITARAFQSTAKYNSWLADSKKYASYVTATVSYTVKVAADTVKAAQTTLSKVNVTFDSAMTDDVKSKISVFKISGTTEIVAAVKGVTLDSTKKIATVEMYAPFAEESTYVIKTTDMKNQQIVAVTSNVADVTDIKITTTQVEANDARDINVDILNKDGVNIGDSELKGRVTFESSNTSGFLNKSTNPNQLTLFNIGDTTTITGTFHTYDYDYATGTEKGIKTATQVVTCVKELSANVGNIEAWTIVGVSPNFNDVKKALTLSDVSGTKTLYVKAKYDSNDDNDFDDAGDTVYSGGSDWSFTSANPGVLNINETTGQLYPATVGTAAVIVKYKDSELGTIVVTVTGKREAASVSLDATRFDLSTDLDVKDQKVVTLTVKDQLGDKLPATDYTATITRSNAVPTNSGNVVYNRTGSALANDTAFTRGSDTSTLIFAGTDGVTSGSDATTAAAVGTHAYTVKVVDNNNSNKVLYGYIQVDVKKPTVTGDYTSLTDTGISYYKVESNQTSYDMKLTGSDFDENVEVSAFGYASNGVKNVRVDFTTMSTFSVELTIPKQPVAVLTAGALTSDKRQFALVDARTSQYLKQEKGTYVLSLKQGTTVRDTRSFSVEDTQTAPVLTVSKVSTANAVTGNADAFAAIQDCFNVTIGGNDVESTITGIDVTGYGKNWFVHKFFVTETLNSKTLKHEVTVNKNIYTAQ